MRNYFIDTLKDGHQKYDSGVPYSFNTFKQAVDRMSKQGPTRGVHADMEDMRIVSQKRREETKEAQTLQKYLDLYKDEENHGNLLYRYLNLDESKLDFQLRGRRDEDVKEATRICKLLKVNFGKKNPNEAFFGVIIQIFNAYLSCPQRDNMDEFQKVLLALLPEFEIQLTEVAQEKIKTLFEFVFQKSYLILETRLRAEEGYMEFNSGLEVTYADIQNSDTQEYQLGEDHLPMAFEFDDLEMNNEIVNQSDFDGIPVLMRATVKQNQVEKEEEVVATFGTEEEAAQVREYEAKLAELQVIHSQPKPVTTTEIHELDREVRPDTPFREFYTKFKNLLCKNEFWQTNLFNCLDMLSDISKANDLLFDQVLGYFDGEMEPTMFILENREPIVAEFIKTKSFMEKKKSKKAGKKYLSNITQKQDYIEDDIGKTNHEVLLMLGMTEKDIQAEERSILKEKQMRTERELDQQLEATYGKKEEDMIDFVNLRPDELSTKAGPNYSRVDFPTHIVFDCKPEPKAPLTGELYPVEQFPEHIARVFGDIKALNQLQTQVKEVAFDSDENMLICAPTGAGKTNVALLAILREFNKTYDHVSKRAGDFKIVYISPLKALATEITEKFHSKMSHAGVVVKEFTGDMSLTRQELLETHIIVSTPEKWDVMTRKSDTITELVKMIIIDEIHLLDEERGRVLECIVARTSITIERRQKNIRLVGLSATLPNYIEVATFMQVKKGLFYFSEAFRPVPLYKKFIGVRQGRSIVRTVEPPKVTAGGKVIGPKNKQTQLPNQQELINQVLYDIVRDNLSRKEQILIFVHSRKDTVKTGMTLLDMAAAAGDNHLFPKPNNPIKENVIINKDLKALVSKGIGAHNAGLSRKDRRLIENGFLDGTLRIVTCTATLAWGVNLPAHTVVIKGTDVYEPGVGFKDLSILDVQQIFGRAGRPQFDSYGEAILITKIEKLNHFMGMMTTKMSVRSQFEGVMLEALNAEIALGNITTLSEAYDYIKRTFYYVRAKKNPRSIGADNPFEAEERINNLIEEKLEYLHTLKFIRYDRNNLLLESTELGRICSHYYVNCPTMEKFCRYLNFYEDANLVDGPEKNNVDIQQDIEDQDLLAILAQADEFNQIQVRQDEIDELHKVETQSQFLEPVHPEFKRLINTMGKKMTDKELANFKEDVMGDKGDKEKRAMDSYKKVMALIQGFLSMETYDNYSLVADTHYIVQNGTRILRCMYDICLKKNIATLAMTVLRMCRYIENNIRDDLSCLRMFCYENVKRGILSIRRGQDIKDSKYFLEDATCKKIEYKMHGENSNYNLYSSVRNMRDEQDLGMLLKVSHGEGSKLKRMLWYYPLISVESTIRPIAQTILKVDLKITPEFYYSKQFHLNKENFEVIVEYQGEILLHEQFGIFTKNLVKDKRPEPIDVSFFVPFKERAEYYTIYIMSDRFVGADLELDLDLKEVMIHTEKMEYTDLLDLRPLKVSILNNPAFERLYKIKYFNPIQTQVFHALYHTDNNCIVGAPTGSGKTIMAEMAMLRIFANSPKQKIVYIGPYKALVKERLIDWKKRLESKEMGKKVLELTGDYTPDLQAIINCDVLVTTPEKWDGISRNWQSRNYVTTVGLIIFDEIHLLGQDRGPVIEVIVSRMNYISAKLGQKIRMIGLSTAMASSSDVASWFGIPKHYMFNFRPNVRPVPVEIHFKGFAEKNYCPRMNTMNKPAFNDIKKFSAHAPVLIFVSSRRQTRLTALDLITLAANEAYGKSTYLKMSEDELAYVLQEIQDSNLKQTLSFGIGMHHAGLVQNDRKIIEELFVENKIQVLIATSTLAWGVNFPAKLVIIKGTEFFDPKQKCYVDMPITDILQMVGRAGRPQFNDKGFACVYVEKSKKNFYRKYLNDPFPIESKLTLQLAEHISAEISAGTITNKQNCMDYLTWTYWFRRITRNPLYYEIPNGDVNTVQKFVMNLIDTTCKELKDSGTITIGEDDFELQPTFLGSLASLYYIQHRSIKFISNKIKPGLSVYQLLEVLSHFEEYEEVPVRHNEENLNAALANICPFPVDKNKVDQAKVKTLLLFQAYFSNLPLPIRDYITDTKLVLDSAVRFLQAMIDLSAERSYLDTLLNLMSMAQMLTQGCWVHQSSLLNLPNFTEEIVKKLRDSEKVEHLCQLIQIKNNGLLGQLFRSADIKMSGEAVKEVQNTLEKIPDVMFNVKLFDYDSENMVPVLQKGKRVKSKDELYVVIDAKRLNAQFPMKVQMKKSAKAKDFSWWIVIGSLEENKVYSLKKTFFNARLHREFQFSMTGKSRKIDILLISDSFIGIDQVVSIDLDDYTTPEPPKKREPKTETADHMDEQH